MSGRSFEGTEIKSRSSTRSISGSERSFHDASESYRGPSIFNFSYRPETVVSDGETSNTNSGPYISRRLQPPTIYSYDNSSTTRIVGPKRFA